MTQKGKNLSEEKLVPCWEPASIFLTFFFYLPDRLLQKGGTARSIIKKKLKSAKLFDTNE